MESVVISKLPNTVNSEITVPSSKSIYNRILIIKLLANLQGETIEIHNPSIADDSALMESITNRYFNGNSETFYFKNAGTPFRLLIPFFAAFSNRTVYLNGDERLSNRPIKPLLQSLLSVGADIEMHNEDTLFPLKIKGKVLHTNFLILDASQSSQFISGLSLIAPNLPNGLSIETTNGIIASKGYLELTLKLMSKFGIEHCWDRNILRIKNQKYSLPKSYEIESDWSSALYFIAWLIVIGKGNLFIPKLKCTGLQPDEKVLNIFTQFGLEYEEIHLGISFSISQRLIQKNIEIDVSNYIDAAPTLACLFVALKTPFKMRGISILEHKESDRKSVLRKGFEQIGLKVETADNSLSIESYPNSYPDYSLFDTQNDHRMAMSFSILSACIPKVEINNPLCVEKSFPNYWEQLSRLGISLK